MKKTTKRLRHVAFLGMIALLAACGTGAVTEQSTGLWDRYIIYNLSQFIIWLSNLFGGSYAMGIIVFTILLRLALTPVTQLQYKAQRKMQEVQPELEKLKDKYPNRDRESLVAMQQEQQAIMAANGVNQWATFIPIFIQLPVMMALYQAIVRTDVLANGSFLWANLGKMDPLFILPVVAAILTYVNSSLMTKANATKNNAMQVMNYVLPAIILLISVGLPAAITLYWVVSNAVTVFQTLWLNNPNKIIAERQAKIQAEKDKQRELKKALKRATKRK